MKPYTPSQLTTILHLQGQIGGSTKFVEPRLVYGTHPQGFVLDSKSADALLEALNKRVSQKSNPNKEVVQGL